MVRSATGVVAVSSVAELLALLVSAHPVTVTVLITLRGTLLAATLTVMTRSGYRAPFGRTSLRMAVTVWPPNDTSQPLMTPEFAAVGLRPWGSESVTVTLLPS